MITRNRWLPLIRAVGILGLCLCSGCFTVNYGVKHPEAAILFPSVYDQLQPEYSSPHEAPSGAILVVDPQRKGRKISASSCAKSILSLVAWGDASVLAAVKKGGIHRIETISYRREGFLWIVYDEFCTTVIGS